MRKNLGILCHITSLPNKYGIGDFGKSCFDFIDFLNLNHFDTWQILPLNPTNDFNCPYSSTCSIALDEMFIDVESLILNSKIDKNELSKLTKSSKSKKVNYSVVKKEKSRLLDLSFNTLTFEELASLEKEIKRNNYLFKYAYSVVLLKHFNVKDFRKTPKELWDQNSKPAQSFIKYNKRDILRVFYAQILLKQQWQKVRKYANSKGIKIIGDLPIYPNPNSFDVFINPIQFKLNQKTLKPLVYGGVPGDEFTDNAQNWGTCVYDWKMMKEDNYSFMFNKIKSLLKIYDILRLDHFYGYVEHYEWSVKVKNKGKWVVTDAKDFFTKLKKQINLKNIIIENLGTYSQAVNNIKDMFNLKGMAVLKFALGGPKDSTYLPQNAQSNDIYYLGTHDNNTFLGFLNKLNKQEIKQFCDLLNIKPASGKNIAKQAMSMAIKSNSAYTILTIQDLLLQDEKHIMNVPGKADGCWKYKAPKNYQNKIRKNLKSILKY